MDNNYNNDLDKEIENELPFNEYYDNSSISSDISDVSSYSEILDEEDSNSENDYTLNQKENFLYEEKQKSFSEVIIKCINKKNENKISEQKEKINYIKSKEKSKKILNYKNNVKNNNNRFNLQLNSIFHELKQKQYDGYFNSLDECNEKIFSKFIKRYII